MAWKRLASESDRSAQAPAAPHPCFSRMRCRFRSTAGRIGSPGIWATRNSGSCCPHHRAGSGRNRKSSSSRWHGKVCRPFVSLPRRRWRAPAASPREQEAEAAQTMARPTFGSSRPFCPIKYGVDRALRSVGHWSRRDQRMSDHPSNGRFRPSSCVRSCALQRATRAPLLGGLARGCGCRGGPRH